MLKVGLTGGIGSGKSTVAHLLRERGFPVLDADRVSRELLENDPDVRAALVGWLGPRAYDPEGRPDRAWIARQVFSHAQALRRLEELLHPRVFERVRTWMATCAREGHAVAIVEAALIVKSGLHGELDRLVVVAAEEALRIQRVMARDGVTEAEVRARMRHQTPQEQLIAAADYVLWNNGSLRELEMAVRDLERWLLQEARLSS
jgi:dephospho-CoA kinase|nr:MAG: dephospho-CoA kinase [Bacteroidota bacterium]